LILRSVDVNVTTTNECPVLVVVARTIDAKSKDLLITSRKTDVQAVFVFNISPVNLKLVA